MGLSQTKCFVNYHRVLNRAGGSPLPASQIDHARHRSLIGFMVNLAAGLIAYSFQAKKPSLELRQQTELLPVP